MSLCLHIPTDAKILAIRHPKEGQIEVGDKAVPGLRIRVGASGARPFVLRKTVAGRYLGRYCKNARQLVSDIEHKADPLASLPAPRRRVHVKRRNEVFDADRCEFDLHAKLWTIPGERAKNGATHLVPLSPAAISIVKELLATDKSDNLLPARGK